MVKVHNYRYPDHPEYGDTPHWAKSLERLMEITMATSKEALAAVNALDAKVNALVAAKGSIPADVQSDLDAIKSTADNLGVKLDTAVAPPVVPPVTPVV